MMFKGGSFIDEDIMTPQFFSWFSVAIHFFSGKFTDKYPKLFITIDAFISHKY